MLGLNGTIYEPCECVGLYHADMGTIELYVAVHVVGTVWVGGIFAAVIMVLPP